jgi:flagellar hook-basal body complex protein FliE
LQNISQKVVFEVLKMITSLQGGNSILRELQALQAEAAGLKDQSHNVNAVQQGDFGTMLANALNNVNTTMVDADNLRTRFDMGDDSVSLSDVMIASQKASMAFEATIQIRNKCVEAYKSIMQMQV